VGSYKPSIAADHDIGNIARHSIDAWGVDRAEVYILELHTLFEMLAAFPGLGRAMDYIRVGYLRFEHESHAIFYQRHADGILVIRVLHRKQQPVTHL
jgi:toxin ParE1/3/4